MALRSGKDFRTKNSGCGWDRSTSNEPASALAHVNRGILEINALYETVGKAELLEECEELRILRSLAKDLSNKMPEDSLLSTRKALRDAIEHERFEEAAQLRDKLVDKNQHNTK